MRRLLAVLPVLAVVLGIGLLAGCSESEDQASGPVADPTVAYAQIIDVRTPSEFAEGHVDGAVNIDVQAADFGSRIAELSSSGTYLVYCRSGNRSAAAAETMREAGLDVVDGGGLDDMRSAGFPVI